MFVSLLLCLIAVVRRIVEPAAQCRIRGTQPGAAGPRRQASRWAPKLLWSLFA